MSNHSLFSAQWHRVRDACPRLASDVEVARHVYRGRIAYVLHRRTTAAHHRLDVASFELVDRLDGKTSVGQLWERAIAERDADAPTQDEWIGLLGELHAGELIVVDRQVPAERLFERRQRHRASERRQRYLNPLYLRFALHDPDAWLNRLLPLAERLFSRSAGYVWLALMFCGATTLLAHGDRLWLAMSHGSLLSAYNAMLFLLVYPPLKILHEFAHALAVKRAGGSVRETGIALMVLLPLPYVDASASAVFPDKRERMLVSAAGILVELACAALGVILWATSGGLLHDMGLAMLLIGGLSTLLLNGNPLLKFDGYYLLADLIEIPNLAARSRRAMIGCLRALVSGQPQASPRGEDRAERAWLLSYGVLSALYRTGLMLSIAWMLSERWFFFGVLLAIVTVFLAVLMPLWKMFAALANEPVFHGRRTLIVAGIAPGVLVLLALWFPLPYSCGMPGVVWLPEEGVVRATGDCEITDVSKAPGSDVLAGDRLFVCRDFEAEARHRELVARVDELQVRRAGMIARDPLALGTLTRELEASEAALADVDQKIASANRTAGLDGRFDVVGTAALAGRALTRGEIVGYVVPTNARTIRVAVDERLIAQVDTALQRVEIRIPEARGTASIHDSAIVRRMPQATRQVSSAALSTAGGGVHPADPQGDGRRLLDAVFDVELQWPGVAGSAPVGAHVGVRFVYESVPLATRVHRAVLRAFDGGVGT